MPSPGDGEIVSGEAAEAAVCASSPKGEGPGGVLCFHAHSFKALTRAEWSISAPAHLMAEGDQTIVWSCSSRRRATSTLDDGSGAFMVQPTLYRFKSVLSAVSPLHFQEIRRGEARRHGPSDSHPSRRARRRQQGANDQSILAAGSFFLSHPPLFTPRRSGTARPGTWFLPLELRPVTAWRGAAVSRRRGGKGGPRPP